METTSLREKLQSICYVDGVGGVWNKETSRGIPRFLTRKCKFESHSKFLYVHGLLRHIKTKCEKNDKIVKASRGRRQIMYKDKSDIRFIIRNNASGNIEEYL